MSNSPQDQKSNSDIKFQTQNIGRWASQQEDPFAKQNRERAEKEQHQTRKRRIALIVTAIVAGILLLAAVIFGVVMLVINLTKTPPSEDFTPGSEAAVAVTENAQQIYDDYIAKFYNQHTSGSSIDDSDDSSDSSDGTTVTVTGSVDNPSPEAVQGAIAAVNEYFAQQSADIQNDIQQNNYKFIQMNFYNDNGQSEDVISIANEMNIDILDEDQKAQCYGMLMNAYTNIGDMENSDYYFQLLLNIASDEKTTEVAK